MPVLAKIRDCKSTCDEDAVEIILSFECPGCRCEHFARIKGDGPVWSWNGSMDAPTFSPSLLVWASRAEYRCHSFVTGGKIQFLDDCAHSLRGQTVPLPEIKS